MTGSKAVSCVNLGGGVSVLDPGSVSVCTLVWSVVQLLSCYCMNGCDPLMLGAAECRRSLKSQVFNPVSPNNGVITAFIPGTTPQRHMTQ